MSTPSFKTLPRYLQRKRGWEKLKSRLRLPLSSIPFPASPRKSTTTQTACSGEDEVGEYFGGALPQDPFARGSFVDVIRPRTTSAATLPDRTGEGNQTGKGIAPAPPPQIPVPKYLPDGSFLPPPGLVENSEDSLILSPLDSMCSTLSFYTSVTSHSEVDNSKSGTHHPLPCTPRRGSNMAMETTTDDEDDMPQLPGAYHSSGYLFRKNAAAAIHPYALSAAYQAFDRRTTPYSLRRTPSSPLLPENASPSPNRRHPSCESDSDDSRPPSYTSTIAPSYME